MRAIGVEVGPDLGLGSGGKVFDGSVLPEIARWVRAGQRVQPISAGPFLELVPGRAVGAGDGTVELAGFEAEDVPGPLRVALAAALGAGMRPEDPRPGPLLVQPIVGGALVVVFAVKAFREAGDPIGFSLEIGAELPQALADWLAWRTGPSRH